MKRVLITGAARGIGRATAVRFAAAGWQVGAFDVDEAALADLGSPAVTTGRLDVRDPAGWRTVLDDLCGPGGSLDALINNAGILRSGPFAELPLAAQLDLVDVNVKGTLIGCHTAFPFLQRAARPVVVNLASASAIYGQHELAVYSATKFAVRGLTEALDLEWRPAGVAVRAVWPLFVQTDMTVGMDIGTTRALGINLTADDVAGVVCDVVARPGRLSVHRGVGRPARLAMAASALGPSWLLRRVNRRLAAQ